MLRWAGIHYSWSHWYSWYLTSSLTSLLFISTSPFLPQYLHQFGLFSEIYFCGCRDVSGAAAPERFPPAVLSNRGQEAKLQRLSCVFARLCSLLDSAGTGRQKVRKKKKVMVTPECRWKKERTPCWHHDSHQSDHVTQAVAAEAFLSAADAERVRTSRGSSGNSRGRPKLSLSSPAHQREDGAQKSETFQGTLMQWNRL